MTAVDLHTTTEGLTLFAGIFAGALADANLCRSTDDVRPTLTRIRIESRPDQLVFTATDGYTLIERTVEIADGDSWVFHLSGSDVPVVIAHVRSAGRANIGVHVADGRLTITADGRDLVCTEEDLGLGASPWPNTDTLWPTGPPLDGEFALNPAYLARVNRLSAAKGAQGIAKIHPFGELKPCLITVGDHTRFLIMPVRIR